MGLYPACSRCIATGAYVATYTKGPCSYMYFQGIFLFVNGAGGLPLPENLGYLMVATCTVQGSNSLMAPGINLYWSQGLFTWG